MLLLARVFARRPEHRGEGPARFLLERRGDRARPRLNAGHDLLVQPTCPTSSRIFSRLSGMPGGNERAEVGDVSTPLLALFAAAIALLAITCGNLAARSSARVCPVKVRSARGWRLARAPPASSDSSSRRARFSRLLAASSASRSPRAFQRRSWLGAAVRRQLRPRVSREGLNRRPGASLQLNVSSSLTPDDVAHSVRGGRIQPEHPGR
jgi:hypothetical protein